MAERYFTIYFLSRYVFGDSGGSAMYTFVFKEPEICRILLRAGKYLNVWTVGVESNSQIAK